MSERPAPPPEGQLLQAALKKSKLSARMAAQQAGISEGRWRQIASGYQVVSAGQYAPVRAPAETVARMANVAKVSAEQLEEAGRPDAADELRRLNIPSTVDPDLDSDDPAELRAEIEKRLAALPPDRRERIERIFRKAEDQERHMERERLRRWMDLIQEQSP